MLQGKKILLIGGSGVLGSELMPKLEKGGATVIAPPSEELSVIFHSDIVQFLFNDKFDLVIHAAAITDVAYCEEKENHAEAVLVNIMGTRNVCEAGRMTKTPVIYISSDYVFDGDLGHFSTDSPTNPQTFYGYTKLAGEAFVQDTGQIFRTSFKRRGMWGE